MDFSVLGPHSAGAWRDWSRRNVEILEGNSSAETVGPGVTESGVRIATREYPAYPATTPALENATIRGTASREVSDGTPVHPDPESLAVVDVAIDQCGHLSLLTETGDSYRYVPDGRVLDRLGCLFAGTGEPKAIAVTEETLYIARSDPGSVHAYSRQLGQTKWILEEGVADPVTFVRDEDDIYLLDRGPHPGRGRLSRVAESAALTPIVTGLHESIDADFDDAGTLYVLEPQLRSVSDDEESTPDRYLVRRFDRQALDRPPVPAAETVWIPPGAVRIRATGERFLPGCLAAGAAGEILVGVAPESDGEQWVLGYRPDEGAFDYHARLSAGCLELVLGRTGDERRLFVIDGDRQLYGIEPVTATRRDRVTNRFEGYLRTHFDAGTNGTHWHRLRLDADGTRDTGIRLQYRATDTPPRDPPPIDPDAERGALRTVSGIRPRTAWRLRRAGIPDLAALVDRDPETIATILGVEERTVGTDQVVDWQTQAESLIEDGTGDESNLQRIDRIGPIRESRLAEGGITTLSEFVSVDPHVVSGLLTRGLQPVPVDRVEEWFDQAKTILEGIPDEPTFAVDEEWTTVSTSNPRDVLLEGATGRYLHVQLELVGTTYESPRVASLDASYPRRTYAEELPAVYREQGGDFLERFLALFEGVFTDVDASIGDLTSYLDPSSIPADSGHLEWLGSFLATEMDEGWPTATKREFVERAPELYRKRGTRRGLLAALEVYLKHVNVRRPSWERALTRERERLDRLVDRGYLSEREATEAMDQLETLSASDDEPLVRVIEHAELECIDDPAVRDLYSRVISCPEGFLVLCHPRLGAEQFRAIGRIVRSQRPAHASGRAVALRHLTVLPGADGERGFHNYLGINTVLESHGFDLEDATLGQDTRLESRESQATLGVRSRLDEDARIS